MEVKKRIIKNIVCFIIFSIYLTLGLICTKYCIDDIFIIKEHSIEVFGKFFLSIIGIISGVIILLYFLLELISVLNTKFYDGILLAINYCPEYDSRGGNPINALIYEIKLIDSGKIVEIIESYIEDENRKKDVYADGTDIVEMYSYKEFKKTSYDVVDYDKLIQISYKYM